MNIPDNLIEKYNIPTPRYTSYPTVPHWQESKMNADEWLSVVQRTFNETNAQQGISIYIHLPYCESLCTYCACNTRITKNHSIEDSYIEALLSEWGIYLDRFDTKPILRELHLGGGTPTFFSSKNLNRLIDAICNTVTLHPEYAFSFEGHPNNTTFDHLKALYDVGFTRVSYGVQDLDIKVQKAINRIQPFTNVSRATEEARKVGFTSINFDLVYGLPFQQASSIINTVDSVLSLQPERIAFYSYAHVPWKRPGQRAYTEDDLPHGNVKRKLYEVGKANMLANGYLDIGMDHFALSSDELYKAYQNKSIHRNFMGYTTATTDLLIGLGTSAISDAKYAYAQNQKTVEHYKNAVENNHIDLINGHFLSEEDIQIKQYILDIICNGEICWRNDPGLLDINMLIQLNQMADEGLITLFENGFRVTDLGMAFIRNICVVFDKRLARAQSIERPLFSQAI
ncbi:MAG: oxygen-independent coproporphyrinogen III oxidase [Bacteroidota bacterium]